MGERKYLVTREELEEAETVAIPFSQKGAANGVATLNASEELTASQVPVSVVNGNALYTYNVWAYGPEGKREYKLLAGGASFLRNGSGHTLADVFPTLAAAQAVYSFATSLTQTVDCAANQAAVYAAQVGAGTVVTPPGTVPYITNSPLVIKANVSYNDLGLGSGFEANSKAVATLQLAKGANCHMVEGDPEAPKGTVGRNQNSTLRMVLDGNWLEQTSPVDGFHLNEANSVTFADGCFVRKVSGVGYYLANLLEVTGRLPARECGKHCYQVINCSDSILWVNGFGSVQGSVMQWEESGGRTCKTYGFIGNSNPPHGKLKETITAAQTVGVTLISEGEAGAAQVFPTWGGTILIGSEQITYTGRTIVAKEVTLEGVTRGAKSTAGAEHVAEANWNEYGAYQDGLTVLGNNARLLQFDLRIDQNWHHALNIPATGVYDSTFFVQTAQSGFENPEAQDAIVVNTQGINVFGNATFMDQATIYAPTANTAIAETVINLTGAKAKGFVNGQRVVITALTGGVTGLAASTFYFVVGAKTNGFELSATEGGAAIAVAGHTLETASTALLLSHERGALQVGSEAKGCNLQVTPTIGSGGGNYWPYPQIINADGTAFTGSENAHNYVVDFKNERVFAWNTQLGFLTNNLWGINLDTAVNARLAYEPTQQEAEMLNVHLAVGTEGHGLRVKEGTNCKQGTVGPMVAGKLTVANTSVTGNSRILISRQGGNSHPGAVFLVSQTAGEGFVVESTNKEDTGYVVYEIFEPA